MRQLLIAVFALSFCLPASPQISLSAQYQWLDHNGQMVFSDQPPPASVPLSRIVRVGDPPAAAPIVAEPPNQARALGKPSLAEQMVEFEKRRTQRKEDRRKRLIQAKRAKAKAKKCQRLQTNKDLLDTGLRVRARNKNGEMAFLTESERAKTTEAIAKQLKKCRR